MHDPDTADSIGSARQVATNNQEKEALEPCPFCRKAPALIASDRDRGLHPSIARLRYSCGLGDHIVAAPWAEIGLGGTHDDPRLIAKAADNWNRRTTEPAKAVSGEVERQALREIAAKGPPTAPRPAKDADGCWISDSYDRVANDAVDEALWEVAQIARAALNPEGSEEKAR